MAVNGGDMFDPADVRVLEHGKDTRELFALIGEHFASPTLRLSFGRPMTSVPGDLWLVWEVNGQVLGFAALRMKPGKSAEICHAWTDEGARRKGFNTWSVGRRVEMARDHGRCRVQVIIKPARAARYEALGFQPVFQRGQYTTYELRLL